MYRYTNFTKPVVPNLKTNHSPTLEDFEVSGDELSISGKQNTLLGFTYGVNLNFLNIISFIYLLISFIYLFPKLTLCHRFHLSLCLQNEAVQK